MFTLFVLQNPVLNKLSLKQVIIITYYCLEQPSFGITPKKFTEMNDKNKTRKNDENIIIMRCELLTSNLVVYHRNCIGVDIATFFSRCRIPSQSKSHFLSHQVWTIWQPCLTFITQPLHLINNVSKNLSVLAINNIGSQISSSTPA